MVAPSEMILDPISCSNILFDEESLNVASFQGLDDGVIGNLVILKWNQIADMGVPAVRLHCYRELLSTAIFKPCNIMALLFCQHEREDRWWWRWWLEEVIKANECLKTGDIKVKPESEFAQLNDQHLNGVSYPKENLPWFVALFNLWCHICQMVGTDDQIKLGKFRLDGDDHTWHMQSNSCSLYTSLLSSIMSNTTPAYPSKTPPPPKISTLMMTCT